VIGVIVSSAIGYGVSLLIPFIEPSAFSLVELMVGNPVYQPVSLFIILALIPMLVSFVTGFCLFMVLRPGVEKGLS
jgi:hypothetical protein